MILELVKAFVLIFIAEMGDKTQILAMAFATKYKVRYVITGIFFGSLFNHALAVLLGSQLSLIIPLNTLSIIAGFSFILFALWNLRLDQEGETTKKSFKYGPTLTVAIAFFIGELGDKTQLTAIALSTDANYPLIILLGTVSGMVFTGIIGIYVGIRIGSKIDDFYIKLGSSAVFFIFGYIKLLDSLPKSYITFEYITVFTVLIGALIFILLKGMFRLRRRDELSYYQRIASELKKYYKKIEISLEEICLGENFCGTCDGNNCLIGLTKNILISSINGNKLDFKEDTKKYLVKDFDKDKVLESLRLTLELLKDNWNEESHSTIHKVRCNFEIILYSGSIYADSFEKYLMELKKIDIKLYNSILVNT